MGPFPDATPDEKYFLFHQLVKKGNIVSQYMLSYSSRIDDFQSKRKIHTHYFDVLKTFDWWKQK